jgi:hypothetical protein
MKRRQHFTYNPATPHPDDDREPQPWTMDEAISFALKVLKDPTATQWQRQKAADELQFSHESQDSTQ